MLWLETLLRDLSCGARMSACALRIQPATIVRAE